MTPRIVAIETANPPLRVTQHEAAEFVRSRPEMKTSVLKWYQRFLQDPGIDTRYFAVGRLEQLFHESSDETIARFEKSAAGLGAEALTKALKKAGLEPEQLDGIVVTTCTGYLCPGLTSHIASRVKLRPDIYAVDLAGLGCGAAIPGLRAGALYLQSHSESYVAVICVEVCSAAMYWDDDIELILSNAIFADGAACAILSSVPGQAGLELNCFGSLLLEEYRDELRFGYRNGRLCNVISPNVPKIATEAVGKLLESCRNEEVEKFSFAAVHPGGRKVLDCLEENLPVLKGKLAHSREVLRTFGNMSSPSVLFVLKRFMDSGELREGEQGIMISFGAGFTAFGAAVKMNGSIKTPQVLKESNRHEHLV